MIFLKMLPSLEKEYCDAKYINMKNVAMMVDIALILLSIIP